MALLEITDIAAAYGSRRVLDGVTLSVDRGKVVGIIGPSGSGKSSLLRVLVGLLPPLQGTIRIDGAVVDFRTRQQLKALRNRCAIVFQQYNLFQNMTVLRNVTIGPIKVKGRDARTVEDEAKALLEKVGLADKLASYPDQLSGGQQQRVALARALALKPEILLLDEVTSALDPELVNEVLDSIRLLASEGMTMIIVSHEMGFIREVSTEVVMMDEGRVIETGSAGDIFDRPQTERLRGFVGKILRH